MTVQSSTRTHAVAQEGPRTYPKGGLRFDMVVVAACTWLLFGLYLDGWAHNQPDLVDSFFTPWHLVFYTGFLSVAVVIGGYQVWNMWRGYRIMYALPPGYGLALIGVITFAFGGPFDFLWHELFGFEDKINALLSPAHLLLGASMLLMFSAPWRAAYHRHKQQPLQGWQGLGTATISLIMIYLVISFFSLYAHPLAAPHVLITTSISEDLRDIFGLFAFLFPTTIMMSLFLLFLRSWQAPFGLFTLFLGVSYASMYFIRIRVVEEYLYIVGVAGIIGLLADLYVWRFDPAPYRPQALRWFAFGLPWALFVSISLIMVLNDHSMWHIHMWLGVGFITGGLGLLLSYLLVPSPHMTIRQPPKH